MKKRDGSGFISKDKLKEVFETLNIEVTEEIINSTIENIDSDGKSKKELINQKMAFILPEIIFKINLIFLI